MALKALVARLQLSQDSEKARGVSVFESQVGQRKGPWGAAALRNVPAVRKCTLLTDLLHSA